MTVKKVFLILFCMVFIAGCALISTKKTGYSKNYFLNVEKQARIRTVMIETQDIKYVRGRYLVGRPESRDYGEIVEYPSKDSFREELIYNGRSGSIIRITYMRKDAAMSPFYQELTFDLGDSDIIIFKNYKIEVLDATDQYIRFKVLKD